MFLVLADLLLSDASFGMRGLRATHVRTLKHWVNKIQCRVRARGRRLVRLVH